jgi:hypothetical protein
MEDPAIGPDTIGAVEQEEAKARAQSLLQYAGDWFAWDEAAQIVLSAASATSR